MFGFIEVLFDLLRNVWTSFEKLYSSSVISCSFFQNSEKYMAFPNGTLVIHDVTDDDVAFYTCRLANSFGEMAESAHLNTSGTKTSSYHLFIRIRIYF